MKTGVGYICEAKIMEQKKEIFHASRDEAIGLSL